MTALKNIDGVSPVLGNTPIAQSPIWTQPVDRIHPAQLVAFRKKMAMNGQKAQADAAIDFALNQIARSYGLENTLLTGYIEPQDAVMTTSLLMRGFGQMQHPYPAAILFALHANLKPEEVVSLTWARARKMARRHDCDPLVVQILRSQPIHIRAQYVFWREIDFKPVPLFGLEQLLFDTFGMVWAEFERAYRRI